MSQFVAAQSPLQNTVSHFVHMIHENRVSTVIALTRLRETAGKEGK